MQALLPEERQRLAHVDFRGDQTAPYFDDSQIQLPASNGFAAPISQNKYLQEFSPLRCWQQKSQLEYRGYPRLPDATLTE
jgi:hypothetical protein